jgi:hypothetical protein
MGDGPAAMSFCLGGCAAAACRRHVRRGPRQFPGIPVPLRSRLYPCFPGTGIILPAGGLMDGVAGAGSAVVEKRRDRGRDLIIDKVS